MAKPNTKIPTVEELEALEQAEDARATAPMGADGAPIQPVDFLQFCLAVGRARSADALEMLIEQSKPGLSALAAANPDEHRRAIETIAARRTLFSAAPNVEPIAASDPADDVVSEVVITAPCWPTLGGTRIHCTKGTIARWTRREIREAAAQGVPMREVERLDREGV